MLSLCVQYAPNHTLANNFHLLTYILAIHIKQVPNMILPALNPTTATKDPSLAFSSAPAIGVPVSPLHQRYFKR